MTARTDALAFSQFQSRYRAASHFRAVAVINRTPPDFARFNLVIERLLISGVVRMPGGQQTLSGFNLVIERLLISGMRVAR